MDLRSRTRFSHVSGVALAIAICTALTSMLVDGRSLITLKTEGLPIVTNPAVVESDLNLLFSPMYGIGLHHDQTGRSWGHDDKSIGTLKDALAKLGPAATLAALTTLNTLNHPASFLSCYGLRDAGLSAMTVGCVADVAAGLMILFHAAALARLVPLKIAGRVAVLVWLVLSISFVAMTTLGAVIYMTTWECDQSVIPLLRLADSFDLAYGLPLAVVGGAASIVLLMILALWAFEEKGNITDELESAKATTADSMCVSDAPLTQMELPDLSPDVIPNPMDQSVAPLPTLPEATIVRKVEGATYTLLAPHDALPGAQISCRLPDGRMTTITAPPSQDPIRGRLLEFSLPRHLVVPPAIARVRSSQVEKSDSEKEARIRPLAREILVAHAWLQDAEMRAVHAD